VLIADGRLNRYWTLVQYQNEIEMSKKITLRLTETNTADEGKWRNRPVHLQYGLDLLKIAGFVILHIGLDPGHEQLLSDG